jgi:hypothetical protein
MNVSDLPEGDLALIRACALEILGWTFEPEKDLNQWHPVTGKRKTQPARYVTKKGKIIQISTYNPLASASWAQGLLRTTLQRFRSAMKHRYRARIETDCQRWVIGLLTEDGRAVHDNLLHEADSFCRALTEFSLMLHRQALEVER